MNDGRQSRGRKRDRSVAGEVTVPLLRTKLTRPQVRAGLVQRPELIARLNQGFDYRLTLVSAPGGYGKTTAIVQWFDALKRPSGWLSLDSLDNDLITFVAYLLAAARTAYPDAGELTGLLLTSSQTVPPETFADALIEDLARLNGSLVLVLDDFHCIHDSRVIGLMERLLNFIPSNVHPVLISRTDPPLSLARLRLRGELAELHADDLRFGPEMAAQLLTNLTGISFDDAAAATLDARTEGWVLALQVAGLTMRQGESPAGLAERFGRTVDEQVSTYLMEEVFTRQPPDIRDFLLRTSILERLSAPLCNALGPQAAPDTLPAVDVLTRLLQTNQMIVPLDESRQWFRYHDLFREFLQNHLTETRSAAEIADLHRRAAAWLGRDGQINEALPHAVSAGDLEMAIELIEGNLHQLLNTENWRQLMRWLELLPAAAQDHPSVLVARGWLHLFHHHIPAMVGTVARAAAQMPGTALSANRRDRLQTQIDILCGIVAYWSFDTERALALLEQSMPKLSPEMSFVMGVSASHLGLSRHIGGQSPEALRYLQSVIDSQTWPRDEVTARLLMGKLIINADTGDLQAGLKTAQTLEQVSLRSHIWNSNGWALYSMGFFHYEMNHLPQAEAYCRRLLESRVQYNASSVYETDLLYTLILLAGGRAAAAQETIEQGRAFVLATNGLMMLPQFAAAEELLRLSQGLPVEPAPAPLPTIHEAITELRIPQVLSPAKVRARCLIQLGTSDRLAEARAWLAVLREAAGLLRAPRQQASIMALEAMAMAGQGDEAGALSTLRQSLLLPAAAQLIRSYVDCGPALVPLLRSLAERGDAPRTTAAILRACEAQWFSTHTPPAAAAPPSPINLTRRDLEVLRLMAEQLSDKQIAARLHVTPASARQYATRIYAKLAVNNRRAAIAAAERLGILPRQ